ncbi:RNA polymerase sigma factor [Evansella tamaricis]|uniref:RNA polymerase sigma factor n=1 Tax=Evansella tamaricis TaxID=2069301 RepID=A0ABS6JCR4_9BACI|nr:RNA polymerase sigma factor [Evansella tamaricis]MBU9710994.1 RNA polymerase sigma factor [Evansella tamaricis]
MGREKDLEEIYSLYLNDLYRYIFSLCKNKHLSEDIVQETFYRAYIYLESYRGEKIKPWLFKVAYHTFIDWMRKEKKLKHYDSIVMENAIDDQNQVKSAEQEFFIKKDIENWFQGLETLTVTKRNALLLRVYFHFSYQEIADLMDISLAKTKVTIYRGRKEIKQWLEKESKKRREE